MRADEFLKLYRVLEDKLGEKLAGQRRAHSSSVMEYLSDADSAPVRVSLDTCREIRNLLTHTAGEDGGYVVEPSEATLDELRAIIAHVERTPMAMPFATPAPSVLKAQLGNRALALMRAMQERGFSHAPVVERGRVKGVFSVSTVFSHVLARPGASIDEDTLVREFAYLLPVARHSCEKFVFMRADASYYDVKAAFEDRSSAHRRLAAVFLTDDGTAEGELLGMITPWDALGKPNRPTEHGA